MTGEDILQVKQDIINTIRTVLMDYQDRRHLLSEAEIDGLYEQVYDELMLLLKGTLTGEVVLCDAKGDADEDRVNCLDQNMKFFVVYDDLELFVIDISPFYVLDMLDFEDERLFELIKVDRLDKALARKIVKKIS